MPLDWKIFTQRPYIKSLPLEEQVRLFNIANEKSIRLREQRFIDFANSNSTPQGAAGDGDTGVTPYTNTYSLEFDGTDDFVEIGEISPRFNDSAETSESATAAPWSLSLWAYISSFASGANKVQLFNTPVGANVYSWKLVMSGGKVQFGARYRTIRVRETGTTAINFGEWNHIVVTFDGVDPLDLSSWKLYINSVDITALTGGGHLGTNGFATMYIGRAASNYNLGKIDEVSLFDYKLTAANVTSIYNGGIPNDISSLSPLAWWNFNEGSGTTAIDSGTGGNNGTISGAIYSTNVPG